MSITTIKEAVEFIVSKIALYLANKFTGKIIVVFNCKDGGIGNVSLHAKQNFSKKQLTPEDN